MNDERMVAITNCEYSRLCAETEDSCLLKNYLATKLKSYGGIKHSELADLCAMFGIEMKEE